MGPRPSMEANTTITRPQTHSQAPVTHKLKAELIQDSQASIKDKDSAHCWLIKKKLIISGEPLTVNALSMALLYLSNGKYNQHDLINGTHAVSLCLEGIQLGGHADDMVRKIISGLKTSTTQANTMEDRPISSKEQALAYLATCEPFTPGIPIDSSNIFHFLHQLSLTHNIPPAVKNRIHATAFVVEATCSSIIANDITNIVKHSIDNIIKQLTTKTATLQNLVDNINLSAEAIKDNALKVTGTVPQPTPSTYSSVAQSSINSEHVDVVARGLNADKQLLIVADKTLASTVTTDLMEKDLVAKANTTLELMVNPSTDKPSINFVTAKILHNGNTLFQLNSASATAWLRNPSVQKAFLLAYSSTANIHNKLFHIIAKFVPLSFDADTVHSHTTLEASNDLSPSSITWSKFVKRPHLCTSNQKRAHIIVGLTTKESASKFI